MRLWYILMTITLAATGIALVYLGWRIGKFSFIAKISKNDKRKQTSYGFLIVSLLFALFSCFINLMNTIICLIYFAGIWFLCDLLFYIITKIRRKSFAKYWAGILAVIINIMFFGYGWYAAHNVWRTEYNLATLKNIASIKIVMFADSHIGTTFDAQGFAKHTAKMQAENPDLLVVVGDFVDDDTNRENMIKASENLGKIKTKYGIYFVFGNHDKGYYTSERRGYTAQELVAELEKNNINVLFDETIKINDNFYLIGRQDASLEKIGGKRKSMADLMKNTEDEAYTLVLDHQPTDFKNQAAAGVDLVLSGHTHGGQLFPFNKVGEWIGANDLVYGYEKRKSTDFIVTSGISDWAIKFKTGTKSEYVIININSIYK